MSDLNDPRVLFAAERTLLAWNRTASGLIALGFFIDRASLMTDETGALATSIGIAFILLAVVLNVLSVVQYRRSVGALRTVEIPPRYWLNLAVFTNVVVSFLGLLLVLYIVRTL
jgi:putative membrane protein